MAGHLQHVALVHAQLELQGAEASVRHDKGGEALASAAAAATAAFAQKCCLPGCMAFGALLVGLSFVLNWHCMDHSSVERPSAPL